MGHPAIAVSAIVFLVAVGEAQRLPPHVWFERPVHTVLSVGEIVEAAAADLNGDGRADLVLPASWWLAT